ncbi:GDSL-type esterase/lipase family protein [Paenibacillus thailandensis]|uniref:GDSL-type esterase/lipase family protein n=1 Tax=Paenibacillus thailandensis TaxID=393250 RepID=A0ABW5R2G9_9BACL
MEKNGMVSYNFTADQKPGETSVELDENRRAPLYNDSAGYGFVNRTCAFPGREVHTAQIVSDDNGFFITEPDFFEEKGFEQENYNNFGMAFRIQVPPGAYRIYVQTATPADQTAVSVSAMRASRLLEGGFWDAAGLIPVKTTALLKNDCEWSFTYANGREYIDVEVEPKERGVPVGLKRITLEPLARNLRREGERPAIYLLGDSTVKSYTFDEAPMSGWGQIFYKMFDENKVKVLNYSMGGRSFKNAYWEGRLNDILISAREGDYLFIQFGHNDESADEFRRYGRGSTEETYETFIREVYLPAIRARGLIPVFVTPMSRVNGEAADGQVYENSFRERRFPDLLKRVGAEQGITVLDLNSESLRYYNRIGVEATTAMFMSIEAGESPGKTNDGTYANGHPANKIDGTHFKEALSKQFVKIMVTELAAKGRDGDGIAHGLASYFKKDVKDAVVSGDWSRVFPETVNDAASGQGAYYRNQIEKMVQLGCMAKDHEGNFHPDAVMSVQDYITAVCKLAKLNSGLLKGYPDGGLTREVMGAILADVYHALFREKPIYMTDYNGKVRIPGNSQYDPNLDSGAQGLSYDPIVPFGNLKDADEADPQWAEKLKDAYELGLIRSEKNIQRGKLRNGTELEPKAAVTRAKAAKSLYFMWVLFNPAKAENHALLSDVPASVLSDREEHSGQINPLFMERSRPSS